SHAISPDCRAKMTAPQSETHRLPIDRFMRSIFWLGVLVVVPWAIVHGCSNLSGNFDVGNPLTIVDEGNLHSGSLPSRGSLFYKMAGNAMADYLERHGFKPVSEPPYVGGFHFADKSSLDDWYGMTDGTRIWVRVLRNGDNSMFAWVVRPYRGWNVDRIERQA